MSDGSVCASTCKAFCRKTTRRAAEGRSCFGGFSLIELLVVIAIIAILAAILFPLLTSAREAGKKARCAVQAKQLGQAIILYTDDNNGYYVPASPDINEGGGGLKRWHGVRTDYTSDFDPKRGPLWAYLGKSGGLKVCPSSVRILEDRNADSEAFESGCGGYGYNAHYIGGSAYKNSFPKSVKVASSVSDIRNPSRTVLLADAAIAKSYSDWGERAHLIEYSFVEPPYMPSSSSTGYGTALSPTIHFRHSGAANVVWCDGHVSSERMSCTTPTNIYGADNKHWQLGWFGPKDNSLFDNR